MKKKLTVFLGAALITGTFASGVIAGDKISAVTAYVNRTLAIQVNGTNIEPKEADGSRIYPIVYNGRTFVPARAVAEALGASVDYNDAGDGTVIISGGSSKPTNVTPATPKPTTVTPTPAPSQNTPKQSTYTGSITSPIPLGETYTWSSTYTPNEKDEVKEKFSGTYSITVKSAKPMTKEEVTALGAKKPMDDDSVGYVMVELIVNVKDAKLISTSNKENPYKNLADWVPFIWGSETPAREYIIGSESFGFEGCLENGIQKATDYKNMEVGATASFTAQGKVVLPVLKSQESYLVIQDNAFTDYWESFRYFKLK